MDHAQQCHSRRTDPLCKGLLTSYLDTYTRYLMERGHARRTMDDYHARFASQWVCHRRQAVRRVDKALVAEFIDEHLPRCNCAEPVRCNRLELRAALNHLLYRTCSRNLRKNFENWTPTRPNCT
jgi:integrase/recombinase XerC